MFVKHKAINFMGCMVVMCLLFSLAATIKSFAADDNQQVETDIASVAERRIIVQLRQQKLENEQIAEALKKERNELNLLKLEVDKKLDQLTTLRKEIELLLVKKDAQELDKVAQLSKMYNKMDPAVAAQIIGKLERELAIGILGNMKSKSAGKVLANMESKKAATLSAAFATLKKD